MTDPSGLPNASRDRPAAETNPPLRSPAPGASGPALPEGNGNDATTWTSESAGSPISSATLEILLVDDSEDDLVLLAEAFRELPQVRLLPPARDGQTALARLRGETTDTRTETRTDTGNDTLTDTRFEIRPENRAAHHSNGDRVATGDPGSHDLGQPPPRSRPRPDLVLLDVNLPGLNGFEVVAAIRAEPRLQTLPVVLLSTSSLDTDVQRAYRSGANSYITKPASFDTLRESVHALVVYWGQTVRIPRG